MRYGGDKKRAKHDKLYFEKFFMKNIHQNMEYFFLSTNRSLRQLLMHFLTKYCISLRVKSNAEKGCYGGDKK